MRSLLLLFLTSCGVEDAIVGQGCTSSEDKSWDITNPDTSTGFQIEQCRVDADTCMHLCTYLMTRDQVSSSNGATGCDVSFDGGTTHVDASYDVTNTDNSNCVVPTEGF
jgi:hypothetical protein